MSIIFTESVNDEGVRFMTDIQLVKPYEYRNGVMVELLSCSRLKDAPDIELSLRRLGFKRVGFDPDFDAYQYVRYPFGYIRYKIVSKLMKGYWWLMRFLYNNARMFQEVPRGERFSWRYFTPYVWMRKLLENFVDTSFYE